MNQPWEPHAHFSTGFQAALLQEYHSAFDRLGAPAQNTTGDGILAGEAIHCLHDFKQWSSDVPHDLYAMNFKGLFSRNRLPKAYAPVLKTRYEKREQFQHQEST